jgi:hypothetical protein
MSWTTRRWVDEGVRVLDRLDGYTRMTRPIMETSAGVAIAGRQMAESCRFGCALRETIER